MAIDTADFKEHSLPGSSDGPNGSTSDRIETVDSDKRSRILTAEDEDEDVEIDQPFQHVRTLGKLRFRPADDDEPQ